MIDLAITGTVDLRLTSKLIAEEALRRGWKAESYYLGSVHMRLTRLDGKVLKIYSATPPTTSYAAASLANDKYATHLLLESRGLPVLDTFLVPATSTEVRQAAQQLLHQGKRCVLKPLDSGHGNGVTVAIDSLNAVDDAADYAGRFSDKLLVQECYEEPVDIRVTCINYVPVGAVVRIPARVQGDGQHTTAELIDIANSNGERGERYSLPLNKIPKDLAQRYLGDALSRTPGGGEWVQVLGTANVGTGGETQDVTAELPDWLTAMAEDAAHAAELPVCGVDFLVARHPSVEATTADLRPVIIELNKCPSLFLNEKPTHGQAVPVVGLYLDYLSTL